jgi:hypothetical protein
VVVVWWELKNVVIFAGPWVAVIGAIASPAGKFEIEQVGGVG